MLFIHSLLWRYHFLHFEPKQAATEIIPDPDLIFWTGDAPAHDIWAYSQSKSDFFLKNITETFRKYYPTSKIFPVIGNHEGVPVNAFPGDDYWLYKSMAEAWKAFRLGLKII